MLEVYVNKSKENLIEYAKAYSEWEDTKKRLIGRMKQVLSRVSEGKIAEVRIQDFDDYSIKFQIFSFNVSVRFTTNVSQDIGCVQWFYMGHLPISWLKTRIFRYKTFQST